MDSGFIKSADGITWTRLKPKGSLPDFAHVLNWNGKSYVAVSSKGVFTSADAISWKETLFSTAYTFQSIASNGKTYIAAGAQGLLCTSQDGINWEPIGTNTYKMIRHVFWDSQRYIAVGDGGLIFISNP